MMKVVREEVVSVTGVRVSGWLNVRGKGIRWVAECARERNSVGG